VVTTLLPSIGAPRPKTEIWLWMGSAHEDWERGDGIRKTPATVGVGDRRI
jgi:hypothetical protein